MHSLTVGICSDKCVLRCFCCCVNIIACFCINLDGTAHCTWHDTVLLAIRLSAYHCANYVRLEQALENDAIKETRSDKHEMCEAATGLTQLFYSRLSIYM